MVQWCLQSKSCKLLKYTSIHSSIHFFHQDQHLGRTVNVANRGGRHKTLCSLWEKRNKTVGQHSTNYSFLESQRANNSHLCKGQHLIPLPKVSNWLLCQPPACTHRHLHVSWMLGSLEPRSASPSCLKEIRFQLPLSVLDTPFGPYYSQHFPFDFLLAATELGLFAFPIAVKHQQ